MSYGQVAVGVVKHRSLVVDVVVVNQRLLVVVVASSCERKILWVLVVVNWFGFIFGVDSCGRLISLKFLGLVLVLVLVRMVVTSWFL